MQNMPATNLQPPKGDLPGHLINPSCNVQTAMFMVIDYLNSTYGLQAADTKLQEEISAAESAEVSAYEAREENGVLKKMQGDKGDDLSKDISQYNAAAAENAALVKQMDANNSTAQNTLSQNSQGQTGLMSGLQAFIGLESNLTQALRS